VRVTRPTWWFVADLQSEQESFSPRLAPESFDVKLSAKYKYQRYLTIDQVRVGDRVTEFRVPNSAFFLHLVLPEILWT
jgi:hypothetical protein